MSNIIDNEIYVITIIKYYIEKQIIKSIKYLIENRTNLKIELVKLSQD